MCYEIRITPAAERAIYKLTQIKVARTCRVIYQIRDEVTWVLVLKVADRKEVYRRLDDLRRLLISADM